MFGWWRKTEGYGQKHGGKLGKIRDSKAMEGFHIQEKEGVFDSGLRSTLKASRRI